MDEQKRTEIIPLNRELYKDLSIDDLEQRLELGCWVFYCENYCVGQCAVNEACLLYGCADYNACPEAA